MAAAQDPRRGDVSGHRRALTQDHETEDARLGDARGHLMNHEAEDEGVAAEVVVEVAAAQDQRRGYASGHRWAQIPRDLDHEAEDEVVVVEMAAAQDPRRGPARDQDREAEDEGVVDGAAQDPRRGDVNGHRRAQTQDHEAEAVSYTHLTRQTKSIV